MNEIDEYPLIEIENLERRPYFLHGDDYTPKSRELYCQFCKYRILSDLYGAMCGMCYNPLITRISEVKIESAT